MRTIKFRAWTQIGKVMSEPFVLGDYKSSKLYINTLDKGNTERKKLIWLEWTGLKDKNGKEIYEGDIVQAHRFGFDGNETDINFDGKIEYRPDGMCFVISTKDGDILVEDTTHFEEPCIEVIGNIYENPELLK